jgi:flagellar basal body-associated protein FliL
VLFSKSSNYASNIEDMANELEKKRVELQDSELMSLADKIVQVIEEGKQALALSINEIIKTTLCCLT